MKNLKTIGLIILVGISATLFTGCKKSGCTNRDAKNYDSKAKESDGSCKFEGQLVFWWKKPFSDSCIANGISDLKVYADGVFQGVLPVSSQHWSSAPSCGTNSTVTINSDLGSNESKVVSFEYKIVSGGVTSTGYTESYTIKANTCTSYEQEW
jgi:hypothetical protein